MTYTVTIPLSMIYTYFAVMTVAFIVTMMFVAREARVWLKEIGTIVIVPTRIPETIEQ